MKRKAPASKKKPSIPYHRKPDDMTIDQWQRALRKQYAEMQQFLVKNTSGNDVFSDYSVTNPGSAHTYKVAIQSKEPGWNFCSCPDFKTNLLGTCKHIEYVLLQINKQPKKRKILNAGYQPPYTSVYLDYGKQRNVKIRVGTEKEKEFRKLATGFFGPDHTLFPEVFSSVDIFLKKAAALHPGFRCYPDALSFILEKRAAKKRNDLIDSVLKRKNAFFRSIIKTELFPYQQEGVVFALRKGRCLIADDMGLGKTIQAIGAAEGMQKLFGISKTLIICPTSLKYQWKSEIEKFTNSSVQVVEGNIHTREKQYAADTFYTICSYHVVGRDLKAINLADYDLVILDEAQRIKNWQTITAKNVKQVQSKYCIVLTGTPIENKLEELYSVVQMVDPLLPGALFRFVAAHEVKDEATGKVTGYRDLDKISGLLQDVLLRRHKRDVLKQLPERMDKNLFVPMTEGQRAYYDDAYELVVKLVHKWVRFKFLSESDRQKMLINLNRMRMACNSTYILDQETRHDTKVDELMSILDEVFENGSEKVVVFSQWERMTRIVAQELDKRDIGYESLHGGVASQEREKLFDNFRNDPESKVFLSTDAGGVGLNLQSASLLINLDLPWNPAVLEQRIARIHRMGQKKKVQIINLISKDTIEENMLGKLKFKSALAAGILDNGESSVFLGESKFNTLMKQVSELTKDSIPAPSFSEAEPEETEGMLHAPAVGQPVTQLPIFDDEIQRDAHLKKGQPTGENEEIQNLISSGSDFFGRLLHTLSDEQKTGALLDNLVKTDEKTGAAYLHIPVKDRQTVADGIKLFGQLLKGLGDKT